MRLFIAADVHSEDCKKKFSDLQKELLRKDLPLRPVSVAQYHITMQFLGEVEPKKTEEIKRALSSLIFTTIPVTYHGIGVFPNENYIRVIWIGVDEQAQEKLTALASEIQSRLQPLGFKPDKKFHPHITLFRVKQKIDANALSPYRQASFGEDSLTTLTLKMSELSPEGPQYTDLLTIQGKKI